MIDPALGSVLQGTWPQIVGHSVPPCLPSKPTLVLLSSAPSAIGRAGVHHLPHLPRHPPSLRHLHLVLVICLGSLAYFHLLHIFLLSVARHPFFHAISHIFGTVGRSSTRIDLPNTPCTARVGARAHHAHPLLLSRTGPSALPRHPPPRSPPPASATSASTATRRRWRPSSTT